MKPQRKRAHNRQPLYAREGLRRFRAMQLIEQRRAREEAHLRRALEGFSNIGAFLAQHTGRVLFSEAAGLHSWDVADTFEEDDDTPTTVH